MTLKPITVTLDRVTTGKIQMIQDSISEPTTYGKVLEGLIDIGFANALKTLRKEKRINNATCQHYLKNLPDYLQEVLPK